MPNTVQLSDLIGGEDAEAPVLDAEDLAALSKMEGYQVSKDMVMATVTDERGIVIACGGGQVLTCPGKPPILRIKAAEVNSDARDRVKPIELIQAMVHLAETRDYAGVSFSKRILAVANGTDADVTNCGVGVNTAGGDAAASDAAEPIPRWRLDRRYPRTTAAVWAVAMSAYIAYSWLHR